MDTFVPPQLELDIFESPIRSPLAAKPESVAITARGSSAHQFIPIECRNSQATAHSSQMFTSSLLGFGWKKNIISDMPKSQYPRAVFTSPDHSPAVNMDVEDSLDSYLPAENVAQPVQVLPSSLSAGEAVSDQIRVNLTEEFDADSKTESSSSYGHWSFCRRTGKKVYVALSGKRLTGRDAVKQHVRDKQAVASSTGLGRLSRREELRVLAVQLSARMDEGKPFGEEAEDLAFWGVPRCTIDRYAASGVTRLFSWQVECLAVNSCSALRHTESSLVYSAPTSGGKTLVAELLMLRRLALIGGTVFFVVPFIALVEEKAEYFRHVWQDLNISVKVFYSEEGGEDLPADTDVCVCTIEKANMLVNKLFSSGLQRQVTMMVIDELHMIADKHRGFLLEVLLSKILFVLGRDVQIIGMSATMPSLADLSRWLGASLYCTAFRPVALQTLVCMDNKLYSFAPSSKPSNIKVGSDSFELVFHSEVVRLGMEEDKDGFVSLCMQSMSNGKSVLLFCPTKERCEVCCKLVVKAIRERCTVYASSRSEREMFDVSVGRRETLEDLQRTPVGVCSILLESIKYGVAYHHAGLISDERKVIEDSFRKGFISVLCTTSTLSAGVNLPAHRVIIRDTKMGPNYLSVSTFRQMAGRAGRLGYNSSGEAILHINSTMQCKCLAAKLLLGDLDPLRSCLHEGFGGGVEKVLLDMICNRGVKRREDVNAFMTCTLMNHQHLRETVDAKTVEAIKYLILNEFVNENNYELRPTQKGCATSHSGISPFEVDEVFTALDQARKKFILKSGFHAVYLVTPISTRISVNWTRYNFIIEQFIFEQPSVKDTLDYLGVREEEIVRFQQKPPKFDCTNVRTRFYKRIYYAIILFNLIQEKPVGKVADSISSSRGDIQQLQKDSSMFCGMTVAFARKLNWNNVAAVLETYSTRLSFGVREELLPLVRMGADMPAFRARFFYGSGLKSPRDIAAADVSFVAQILLDCVPFDEQCPLDIIKEESKLNASTKKQVNASTVCTASETKFDRLAKKIIETGKESVRKDIELLYLN